MTILILNRLPAFLTNYPEWLKDLEEEVILFTHNKYKENYKGITYIEGFDNYLDNPLIELRAVELYNEKKFHTIIALDEVDIIRAARIREHLNLKGQRLENAYFYRNKLIMKQLLTGKVSVPNYNHINSSLDIIEFIEKNDYPIVIKPIDGMGGINTFIIKSSNDLHYILQEKNICNGDYMIESYVEGDMYSIDGLLVKGNLEFCSVTQYHNSVLVYKENVGHSIEILSPNDDMYIKLSKFILKVLEASKNPDLMVFHCEVFVNQKGEITFCEIASRLGGARIPELINQSYGINLEEVYCRLSCNLYVDFPLNNQLKKYTGVYLVPKHIGKLVATIESFPFDWVTEYQPYIKTGFISEASISSSDIFGTVVFIAENKEQLAERLEIIKEFTQKNIVWETNMLTAK